jgi:hypothetical protein
VARGYTLKTAALIVGVEPKWLDNLLSRYAVPGVTRARQGIQRQISEDGLLAIDACRVLNLELGVSLARAAEIAADLFSSPPGQGEPRFETPSGLTLIWPLTSARQVLRARIIDAVEQTPVIPRGRPPSSRP